MDKVVANNSYRYKRDDGTLDDVHYCLNAECDSLTEVGQPMVDNNNGTHTCPSCSGTVTTDEGKLAAYEQAAVEDNERRTREISKWLNF